MLFVEKQVAVGEPTRKHSSSDNILQEPLFSEKECLLQASLCQTDHRISNVPHTSVRYVAGWGHVRLLNAGRRAGHVTSLSVGIRGEGGGSCIHLYLCLLHIYMLVII